MSKFPVVHKCFPGCEDFVKRAAQNDVLWLFLRADRSPQGQDIPTWAGFVSINGVKPTMLTKIDYL